MRLVRHRRGNPDTEYVEAYPTAPPLDSTLSLRERPGTARSVVAMVPEGEGSCVPSPPGSDRAPCAAWSRRRRGEGSGQRSVPGLVDLSSVARGLLQLTTDNWQTRPYLPPTVVHPQDWAPRGGS
jgi:hypothetical protein